MDSRAGHASLSSGGQAWHTAASMLRRTTYLTFIYNMKSSSHLNANHLLCSQNPQGQQHACSNYSAISAISARREGKGTTAGKGRIAGETHHIQQQQPTLYHHTTSDEVNIYTLVVFSLQCRTQKKASGLKVDLLRPSKALEAQMHSESDSRDIAERMW